MINIWEFFLVPLDSFFFFSLYSSLSLSTSTCRNNFEIHMSRYNFRTRQREKERQDKLWDISNASLLKARSKAGMESMRSLQSGPSSTSTKMTLESKKVRFIPSFCMAMLLLKDSVNYSFFVFNRELVCCAKYTVRVTVFEPNRVEMRMVRMISILFPFKFFLSSVKLITIISIDFLALLWMAHN